MSGESCPLPSGPADPDAAAIERMIRAHRIAVVGLSDDPSRPSFGVASYLLAAGKQIIPINPNHSRAMGLACYPSLAGAPVPIDLVNVFRRAEFCPDIVRDAISVGAKGVWLQAGIVSAEARKLASQAGIDFVQNRCLMVEHMRHAGSD
jgi:predicted CoA-binding protein